MKVPATVNMPSMSTMKPAVMVSRLTMASSSTGPRVGRLRTTDTITLPLTSLGQQVAYGAHQWVDGHAHRVLDDHSEGPHALGPRRHHVGLGELVEQVIAHDADQACSSRRAQDDRRDPKVVQHVQGSRYAPGASWKSPEKRPPTDWSK